MKIIEKKIDYIFIFFCILFPISLITGPFLPDLLIVLLSFFFLYDLNKNKNFTFLNNRFFFIFLSLYFYLLLSSLNSNYIFESLSSSLFYFRFIFYTLGLCYFFLKIKNSINLFSYSIIVCIFTLLIDTIFQIIYGFNILGFKVIGIRYSSFFGDELIMGSYISKIAPVFLAIYMLKLNLDKKEYFFISVIFCICFFLIYSSGERTAFYNFCIFSLLFLIYFYRIFVLLFALVLVLFLLIFHNTSDIKFSRMFLQPFNGLEITTKDKKLEIKNNEFENDIDYLHSNKINIFDKEIFFFNEIYHRFYLVSKNIYFDNLIIGAGPKNYRNYCSDYKYALIYSINNDLIKGNTFVKSCNTHPHNYILQFVSELGSIGLLIYFIFFIFLIYNFIYLFLRNMRSKFIDYSCSTYVSCIAIIVNLNPFITSGNFFNNWNSILFYLPIITFLYTKVKYDI